MFDTMTLTKTVGAFCGALLVFLLGKWAADTLYAVGGGHGGEHEQAYVIDTGEEDAAAEEEVDEGPSLAALWAEADPDKGANVFNQCRACHQVEEGQNGVGPHLYGVVGREVQAVADFSYSGSLAEAADVWTVAELDAFLENPSGYAPGTTMGFAGLSDPEDRVNVIAYLDQTDGDMVEMEAPAEEPAAEESETAGEPADGDAAADADGGGQDFAAMVAAADPADGEGVFRQCQACHKLEEGQHGVGPSLYDVVGEKVASVEDFRYSNALKDKGGEWTAERLSAWLENPQDFASGTTMGYAGLADAEDRAAVIAYMDAADGTHDIAAASSSDADAAADAQPADEDGAAGGEATQEDAAGDDGAAEQGAAEDGAAADDEAMTDGASTEEAASDTGGAAQSEIAAMVAAADPADGKNVFNRCRACHKLEEGQNGVGPHLYGVVGSDVASVEDFRYSSALEDLGGKWTPERMDAWLENPRDFAPGNKMSFAGLRDAEDRAAVIAYMQSVAE